MVEIRRYLTVSGALSQMPNPIDHPSRCRRAPPRRGNGRHRGTYNKRAILAKSNEHAAGVHGPAWTDWPRSATPPDALTARRAQGFGYEQRRSQANFFAA